MPVTVRAPRQIASGLNAFFEAAADGNQTTALLAAVMQAVFAVAISSRVVFELAVPAGVWLHIDVLLVKLKTN